MAVDNSAAESARSLLNGIDYSALIGGPLQAAITAQAMAAKSTWEFIQQVGLNTDADGNKSAVNVSFIYQRDGQMVKLIVPILTIVPIPLIVVDEISIDFTASINASASSTSEDSKAQDIGGELSASGRVGWGPFSLNASMKASYSSKQSSRATQDSRYSVQYTQIVRVHARQADMPAGLATVLNILSAAATGGTLNGELTVSPVLAQLTQGSPTTTQTLQIKTKNADDLNVASAITVSMDARFKDCFALTHPLSGEVYAWTDGTTAITTTVNTDANGNLALNIAPASAADIPAGTPYPVLSFSAAIAGGGQDQQMAIPINVSRPAALPTPAASATLTIVPTEVALSSTASEADIVVTGLPATDGGSVTATVTGDYTIDPSTGITFDAQGAATVTVTRGTNAAGGSILFSATVGGQSLTATLDIVEDTTLVFRRSQPRPRPRAGGLDARPESTRQFYTFTQEPDGDGAYAPVSVRILSSAVRVRCNELPVDSGERLVFDDQHRARVEFEVGAGIQPREEHVVFETVDGQPIQVFRFD